MELGSDGGASVTIDYELVDVADVREVEVALLGFDAAATDEILADGRVLELEPASGSRRAATLGLTGAAGDGPRSLRLTYRIAEAVVFRDGALRARVPVATVSLPPAADSGDVFHARLTLPRQWSVAEGFPSRLVATEAGVYGTDLRVVPSVVSLRGRTDGAWRPGVKLLIDLLTVAILAGVAVAGWRHMRGMSA